MLPYKTLNRISGWLCFLIATSVYALTIEPSASFWDCPEFILSAARLEVGHPPGAPFFMLAGNFFSLFASSPDQIARCINLMNAILSGGCILFLFWSITHLTYRLMCGRTPYTGISSYQKAVILGSGFVGSQVYAFSDTFWYSAVEGEVYAFSSFFTAVTFWITLRWEEEADSRQSDRWIILLAYLIGLSIGVHLLNLLCIPAISLVFYHRKWKQIHWKGTLFTLFLSACIIATVLYGIVPGVMKVAGLFELAAVNGCGTPYHTGMILYICLLGAVLIGCCRESMKATRPLRMCILLFMGGILLGIPLQKDITCTLILTFLMIPFLWKGVYRMLRKENAETGWRILRTLSFCLLMTVCGYASYALILIRSTANPPMNQQSPNDPFTLQSYLGREQYGDTPLLYGPTFASPRSLTEKDGYWTYDYRQGAPEYRKADLLSDTSEERYCLTRHKLTSRFQPETCVWFPRMYKPEYADAYKAWTPGYQGKTVTYWDNLHQTYQQVTIPSWKDNLSYFLFYQVNYMYLRYFFWNFVGRQNDIQGSGEAEYGNWITGFTELDNFLVAPSEHQPDLLKENKGRNVYYGLPLLLGILGLCWQTSRGKEGTRQFQVVLFLFFMTGLAIILYLNQTPNQPRERDYAYAGSFYAFAIWIGMGTAALAEKLKQKLQPHISIVIAFLLTMIVPLQMISQTWDDHDRSGRYICRDTGWNYLNSVQETGNPILFVNADNDTFPLWYNTEVEGVRTDIRVCNLMYLTGSWYVDQMKLPSHRSPGIPFSIPRAYYRDGVNDYVRINPAIGTDETGHTVRLKETIEEMYRNRPDEKPFGEDPWEWKNIVRYWLTSDDESMRCIPTDEIHIPIDKEAVRRSGIYLPDDVVLPDTMIIQLKDRDYLMRTGIVLLDLIDQCNWERPLYVATSVNIQEYLDLAPFLQQEGLASRIVPFHTQAYHATTNPDLMYTNLLQRFRFGGLEHPDLYLDETNRQMAISLQRCYVALAQVLYEKGDTTRMKQVLDYCDEHIRHPQVRLHNNSDTDLMGILYFLTGEEEKGKLCWQEKYNHLKQTTDWYNTFPPEKLGASKLNAIRSLYALDRQVLQGIKVGIITDTANVTEHVARLENARRCFQKADNRYVATIDEMLASYIDEP